MSSQILDISFKVEKEKIFCRVVTSSIWSLLYAEIALKEAIHAESYS